MVLVRGVVHALQVSVAVEGEKKQSRSRSINENIGEPWVPSHRQKLVEFIDHAIQNCDGECGECRMASGPVQFYMMLERAPCEKAERTVEKHMDKFRPADPADRREIIPRN